MDVGIPLAFGYPAILEDGGKHGFPHRAVTRSALKLSDVVIGVPSLN